MLFGYGASQITIEEDISKFFPVDKKLEKINQALWGSRFTERLVVMVSMDSSQGADPERLILFADSLVAEIQESLPGHVREINYRVNDDLIFETFDIIYNHLPVFLSEKDYEELDSLTRGPCFKNHASQ